MEHLLRENKVWRHVQGTMAIPGPVLALSEGATPVTPSVPAIVATMGISALLGSAAIAISARVTQVHVDAS